MGDEEASTLASAASIGLRQASAEKEVSPTEHAFRLQGKALEQLAHSLNRLEARIQPVLVPVDRDRADGQNETKPSSSYLVERLQMSTGQVLMLDAFVNELISRVEV